MKPRKPLGFRILGWSCMCAIVVGVLLVSLNLVGLRLVANPTFVGVGLLMGALFASWFGAVVDLVLYEKGLTFEKWREYIRINYSSPFSAIEQLIRSRHSHSRR